MIGYKDFTRPLKFFKENPPLSESVIPEVNKWISESKAIVLNFESIHDTNAPGGGAWTSGLQYGVRVWYKSNG